MASLVRTRALTMGATAALAGGALAGCGAEDSAKHAASDARNAIDPVAQAADATSAQQGGIAMTMKGAVTAGGQDVPLDGSGVVDRQGKSGTFAITTAVGGKSTTFDEIIDGKVIYIKSDVFAGQLPGGKKWVKVDLAQEAAKQGIDLDAIGGSTAQDPAAALDYLKGAGTSRKVGTATVNGTKTTQYHVDVDLRKVAAKSDDPDAKSSVEKLIKAVGTATIPVDVWVDAKHLVRREKLDYALTIQGHRASMTMTIDLTKFGVAVHADPPAAGDVADLAALTGAASGTTAG
jgi:hypothetical protein